jgi:hypothetical protein
MQFKLYTAEMILHQKCTIFCLIKSCKKRTVNLKSSKLYAFLNPWGQNQIRNSCENCQFNQEDYFAIYVRKVSSQNVKQFTPSVVTNTQKTTMKYGMLPIQLPIRSSKIRKACIPEATSLHRMENPCVLHILMFSQIFPMRNVGIDYVWNVCKKIFYCYLTSIDMMTNIVFLMFQIYPRFLISKP